MSPALAGGFLTTAPPGKSQQHSWLHSQNLFPIFSLLYQLEWVKICHSNKQFQNLCIVTAKVFFSFVLRVHFNSLGSVLLHLHHSHPGTQADGADSDWNTAGDYGRGDVSIAKQGLALKASTDILLDKVSHTAKAEYKSPLRRKVDIG